MSCCGASTASPDALVDNRLLARNGPAFDHTYGGYNVSRNPRIIKLKCVFLGGPGVGKTTLFKTLIGTNLDGAPSIATYGDFAPLNLPELELNGRQVVVALTDTNGQENFNAMTSNYLNKAAVIVAVFNFGQERGPRAITLDESFYRLLSYLDMRATRCLHSIVIVYCNKMDLSSDEDQDKMRTWFVEINDKIGAGHVHIMKGCSFLHDTRDSFYADIRDATQKFIANYVNKRT